MSQNLGSAESMLLDGHDFDELDALLDRVGNDQTLALDGVHGLLSALAIGPNALNAEDWLPLALGEHPRLIEHPDIDRCVELLLALRASIDYALEHFSYEPVFMEDSDDGDEPEIDQSGWCLGFAVGVDLLSEDWEPRLCSDLNLARLATELFALGVFSETFQRCLPEPPALTEEERESLIRQLPTTLLDIRQYWEEDRDEYPQTSQRLH